MSIETYNRLRNVQSLPIQHNYSIMGGRNEEHIDRVLNIKAFTQPQPKPQQLLISKTIQPCQE